MISDGDNALEDWDSVVFICCWFDVAPPFTAEDDASCDDADAGGRRNNADNAARRTARRIRFVMEVR